MPNVSTFIWPSIHIALGQDRQMLGFLGGASLLQPQMISDDAMTVTILSMTYHHPEQTGNNRDRIKNHFPQLQDRLGENAFETAWEMGKELGIDDVVTQLCIAWSANKT